MKRWASPLQTIRWRLILSSLAAICIPLAILSFWLASVLWQFYLQQLGQELQSVAWIIAESAAPVLASEAPGGEELHTLGQRWERHSRIRIVVADSRGVVQAATVQSLVGGRVSEERTPGLAQAIRGEDNATIWKHPEFDFEDTMYVNVPVRHEDRVVGGVRVSYSLADVEEKLGLVERTLTAAIVVYIVLIVVLTFGLAASLVRPVEALNRSAGVLAAGNLEHRVEVEGTTEINQLAETLNQMAERLHRLESMRRQYVSDVSHELRAPLASIRGMAETLLEHGVADPTLRDRYLPRIITQTERLARLASQLLDLAQIESGNLVSHFSPVEMAGVIDEAVATSTTQVRPSATVAMNVEVARDLPRIPGDRDRLVQMLINLLDNAFRHTPEGGRISVEARNGRGRVLVSVADTGPGIPQDHLPHIFERFYRVDRARSASKGGAGLGLAIVRQIVEAHRGTIQVQSAPGQGTLFEITLPVGEESR